MRTMGRGIWRSVSRSDRGAHWAKIGEDWYQTLGELKGAAMKLGQLASQYRDLLPPEVAEQLARLQASAEPLPWERIIPELDAAWTAEQWAMLASVEEAPVASASIGQVHVGQLKDGRRVAIKVRYPGVTSALDADVQMLGRILRTAGLLPIDRSSLKDLLQEVRARLAEEMDYRQELTHLQRFAALPGTQGLVIPQAVEPLCGDAVLVTEFIEAADLETARTWPQALRDQIGARYVDWMIEQVFTHGIIHADPHPGNYRFFPDGRIALFDFGCVKQIRPTEQALLAEQVALALARDWPSLHRNLGEIGSLSRPDRELSEKLATLYETGVSFLVDRLLVEPAFDFTDERFITDARALMVQALPQWRQFKPVPELAFVARSISGGYWLLRRLGARVDLRERIAAIGRA